MIALGLFKDEADVENSPEQTFSPNLKPGDIKYKDLNGDGKIDSNDMTEIGDPTVPQIVYMASEALCNIKTLISLSSSKEWLKQV